jgi:hypothetical protein
MAILMSIHMSNQMYTAIILLGEMLAKKYDADPSAPDSCLAASLAGSWGRLSSRDASGDERGVLGAIP